MNKIDYSSHNWLALKINNNSFEDVLSHIRGRVVDLGCGIAPYKKDILKVAEEYIGVDWDKSAHDQNHVDIFSDLSETIPIKSKYVDTVVAFQVLEHIPEPDLFLSECCRILKPGGRIVLTVPFMWHIHEAPHDYFRFTRYGLVIFVGERWFC